MNILAIETSCDDTGIAILKKNKNKLELLSNIVSSQIKIHKPYGGVVPNLAARAHLENIKLCLESALKQAGKQQDEIDLIAVTKGPGLIPCLQIGVNFAKALAYAWQKPIIGINHIEGHIYANWLSNDKINFPALCLIVSGGHTQLVLMENHGKYKLLGQTRDDAAGEAFDKVAKLLGLGYPGGPIISQRAEKGNIEKFALPRPMIRQKNFDFSFSGLKTAVLYEVKKISSPLVILEGAKRPIESRGKATGSYRSTSFRSRMTTEYINNMSASFQQAVIDVLISKTIKAVEKYNPKTILLAGGVIANKELRKQIQEKISDIEIKIPEIKFCTDNAAMIAAAACFNKKNQHWSKINADSNLKLI